MWFECVWGRANPTLPVRDIGFQRTKSVVYLFGWRSKSKEDEPGEGDGGEKGGRRWKGEWGGEGGGRRGEGEEGGKGEGGGGVSTVALGCPPPALASDSQRASFPVGVSEHNNLANGVCAKTEYTYEGRNKTPQHKNGLG